MAPPEFQVDTWGFKDFSILAVPNLQDFPKVLNFYLKPFFCSQSHSSCSLASLTQSPTTYVAMVLRQALAVRLHPEVRESLHCCSLLHEALLHRFQLRPTALNSDLCHLSSRGLCALLGVELPLPPTAVRELSQESRAAVFPFCDDCISLNDQNLTLALFSPCDFQHSSHQV